MITKLQPSDLKLLRLFVQVANSSGFSAASEVINIGQSTISSQFKTLEERLGFSLCKRGRSGFELTPEGVRVLEAAKTLEEGVSDFIAKIAGITNEIYGSLRIGVSQILSRDFHLAGLPELIRILKERTPGLNVRIDIESPADLENGVEQGDYDIGYMETDDLRKDLDSVKLFDVYAHIYCSKRHPLFNINDDAIDNYMINKQKSVFYRVNTKLRNPTEFSDGELTSSSEASIFYILSGQYIGYLSDIFAEPWFARGELRQIAPHKYHFNSPGGLVFRKSSQSNPVVRHAIEVAQLIYTR